MPYFKWYGVTITGEMQRGKLFAQSPVQLDEQLFKRQIALITYKKSRSYNFFSRISLADKIALFHQLRMLISAGVLLPRALTIVAEQTSNRSLQELMYRIADAVHRGDAFSLLLQQYSPLFGSLVVQLVLVGEQSGNMSAALQAIETYLETKRAFYAQLRSVLFMPVLTFIFFLLIALVIFVAIVPRFADLFASLGQELPPLTKTMIEMSRVISSGEIIWFLLPLMFIVFFISWYLKSDSGKQMYDKCLLSCPVLGSIIKYQLVAQWLDALSLLVGSGMLLVPALRSVEKTVVNTVLRLQLQAIADDVEAGSTLASALYYRGSTLFSPDLIAMISVGQEVSALDTMLHQGARIYYEKFKARLALASVSIQPVLLIFLACLILLLIIAVYMPILSLSSVV